MFIKFFGGIIFLLSLLTACTNSSPSRLAMTAPTDHAVIADSYDSKQHLQNTHWQLKEILDLQGSFLTAATAKSITLDLEQQKASGQAGCNNYFAAFQMATNGSFALKTAPITTLMACTPAIDEAERHYLALLVKARRFSLDKDLLTLFDAQQTAILKFQAINAVTLEKSRWQAVAINNGHGGVVSDTHTALSTLRFVNGDVHGKAGCNEFSATYRLVGQQLTISQADTTRMFCSEAGIMEQEANFLGALMQVRQYRLQADRLELRDSKGALWLSFVKQGI